MLIDVQVATRCRVNHFDSVLGVVNQGAEQGQRFLRLLPVGNVAGKRGPNRRPPSANGRMRASTGNIVPSFRR